MRLTGLHHGGPQCRRVVDRAVDLEPKLARVARARQPAGHASHRDPLVEEAEVAKGVDVGALGDRPQHLAGLGPLNLEVGHLGGSILDLHVEPAVRCDLSVPGQVRVVAGDRHAVVIGQLEHGAVHDHLALVVADRAVANLTYLQRRHVIGEQRVGQLHRVGAAQDPLAQRRLIPHVARRARCLVFGDRVAEVSRPGPTLPVGPCCSQLALNRVERSAVEVSGRHLLTPHMTNLYKTCGAVISHLSPSVPEPARNLTRIVHAHHAEE